MTTWATRPTDTTGVDWRQLIETDELAGLRDLAKRRAAGEDAGARLVLVTMGTDHHRFERLSQWIEQWQRTAPADVEIVVQHGTSRRPSGTHAFDMLRRPDLLRFMRGADAVITQGGPGGILDSRASGRLPIVVPRSAALHEHVDDHQQAFAQHMSQLGQVALATTEQAFRAALDQAMADPDAFVASSDTSHVSQSVQRFGSMVDQLVTRPRGARRWFGG